jgi:CheY-like chemotaxis protein
MGTLDGTRVLVIDDNLDMRCLMTAWIESTEATVIEAAGGEEGLILARLKRPHLKSRGASAEIGKVPPSRPEPR